MEEECKNRTVKQIKDKLKFLLAGIAYETLNTNSNDNMSEEETDNWHAAKKLASKLKRDFFSDSFDVIIQKCLKDSKNIIKNNITKLNKLKDELLNKKSLSKKEILKLVE